MCPGGCPKVRAALKGECPLHQLLEVEGSLWSLESTC